VEDGEEEKPSLLTMTLNLGTQGELGFLLEVPCCMARKHRQGNMLNKDIGGGEGGVPSKEVKHLELRVTVG